MFTFGVETVHHSLYDVQLVFYGKVDEVGIQQDMVWWAQLRVVAEIQRRRHLRPESTDSD